LRANLFRRSRKDWLWLFWPREAAGIALLEGGQFPNRLNAPGDFRGEIGNRDMIGKTADELVARWNEEHPDDPVE